MKRMCPSRMLAKLARRGAELSPTSIQERRQECSFNVRSIRSRTPWNRADRCGGKPPKSQQDVKPARGGSRVRSGVPFKTSARMSLTSWYYLRLEEPQSNRRFVIPPVVAILTLAAMLLVVRVAKKRA